MAGKKVDFERLLKRALPHDRGMPEPAFNQPGTVFRIPDAMRPFLSRFIPRDARDSVGLMIIDSTPDECLVMLVQLRGVLRIVDGPTMTLGGDCSPYAATAEPESGSVFLYLRHVLWLSQHDLADLHVAATRAFKLSEQVLETLRGHERDPSTPIQQLKEYFEGTHDN